jgi:serine/threonine protein phosphatase 1
VSAEATDGEPRAPGRLIAIGDVHGCVHALEKVLEAIEPVPDDRIVFLGDLIDQGKESKEVLELVLKLRDQAQVTLIQGNHEEMLFAARENEQALRYWERCGGVSTLTSYRFSATLADIPASHWELLESCLPYYETDDFIFSHANYVADEPMADLPGYQLRWDLFDPKKEQPHFSGKTVVVGHTEQKNAEILDLGFAMCIDTVCWKYGWLSAIDLPSREVWQASRWGILRETDETSHRGRLMELLRPSGAVQ